MMRWCGRGIWGRDLRMERKRKSRAFTGEIHKVGDGSGMEYAGIHGKGEMAKREIEGEGR